VLEAKNTIVKMKEMGTSHVYLGFAGVEMRGFFPTS